MARAARQQARRAGAACAGAAARLEPALCAWGMSATLGNLDEAMHTLLGRGGGTLVQGQVPKKLRHRFAASRPRRALSLGRPSRPHHAAAGDRGNRGAAAPRWSSPTRVRRRRSGTRHCLRPRPDWAGLIALHHGSLGPRGARRGSSRPQGGRAARPWSAPRASTWASISCRSSACCRSVRPRAWRGCCSAPAAVRPCAGPRLAHHAGADAQSRNRRRRRPRDGDRRRPHRGARSPIAPLDVLVQHLVTVALGGGFVPDALYEEVREHRRLCDAVARELALVSRSSCAQGGPSLRAYPDYRRVVPDAEGVWRVPDARLALRHRMNIGTIVSDASMPVQYARRARAEARQPSKKVSSRA